MGFFEDVRAIEALEKACDEASAMAERWGRMAVMSRDKLGTIRANVERDPTMLSTVANLAREHIETLLAEGLPDPDRNGAATALPPPVERKGRGPDRAPRKRKEGSVIEPKGTPPEQIERESAELLRALADGPLTLAGITTAVSFVNGADVTQDEAMRRAENALTNDPERFVGWLGTRDGDFTPVNLWGTREQFYAEVTSRFDLREKSMTVPVLINAARCGASAAAWAIDRARFGGPVA